MVQSAPFGNGRPSPVPEYPGTGIQAVRVSVLGWFGLATFSQRLEPWFCLTWGNLAFCLQSLESTFICPIQGVFEKRHLS